MAFIVREVVAEAQVLVASARPGSTELHRLPLAVFDGATPRLGARVDVLVTPDGGMLDSAMLALHADWLAWLNSVQASSLASVLPASLAVRPVQTVDEHSRREFECFGGPWFVVRVYVCPYL